MGGFEDENLAKDVEAFIMEPQVSRFFWGMEIKDFFFLNELQVKCHNLSSITFSVEYFKHFPKNFLKMSIRIEIYKNSQINK